MKSRKFRNSVLLGAATILLMLSGITLIALGLSGGLVADATRKPTIEGVTSTSIAKPLGISPPAQIPGSLTPATAIIPVELRPTNEIPIEDKRVLLLPWGSGPQAIGAPLHNEGPGGFDISPDGIIVLIDGINDRVLFYDTRTSTFHQCPVPQWAEQYVDIDQRHWFVHLWSDAADPAQKYMLIYNADCEVVTKAPIDAEAVYGITDDWEVYAELNPQANTGTKLMAVLDDRGNPLSPEEQHASMRPHADLWAEVGLVEGIAGILHDDTRKLTFRLDLNGWAPFYLRSTDTGYVIVGFVTLVDRSFYRVTWFDTSGKVVKDVLAPRLAWRSIFGTRVVAREQSTGDIYVIGDTPQGVTIYRVASPETSY